LQLATSSRSADEENFDKMKAAYDACLDEDTIKDLGVGPLMHILDQVRNDLSSGIKPAILRLAGYGVPALITSGTSADDRDPDTVVVSVSPPWVIGLPSKERYEESELVEKYRNVIVEVLRALYPDTDKEALSNVVEFEKRLAAASPDSQEREDVTVCCLTCLGGSPRQGLTIPLRNTTTQCPWNKRRCSLQKLNSPPCSPHSRLPKS
jgi:endothelin-converting enzyme